ncbi:hypothetical protein OIU79_000181 [Salix purpurea]|uniref:Uncharacterized protein n=1 Tax=Salix purpurea TaxID=77065 RepID=A0A9Q0ZMI8_SALPP|nr:hypothetical protein OIU79_000181 [Salix purpurea]
MEIAREFGALLCLALVFRPFFVLGLKDFEERNGVAHFNTSQNDVHSSGSHNVEDDHAREGRTNSTYKDALVEHNSDMNNDGGGGGGGGNDGHRSGERGGGKWSWLVVVVVVMEKKRASHTKEKEERRVAGDQARHCMGKRSLLISWEKH